MKFKAFSWGDSFVEHGKPDELEALNGLNVEKICSEIEKMIDKNTNL